MNKIYTSENPLLSIIIPVFNVEAYIDECLRSVTNQTFRDIEIILVDDGSTDSSGAKCDYWSQQDSRIVVIHKDNEGLGYARNSGMAIARGEFIAFVDSDDMVNYNTYSDCLRVVVDSAADVLYFSHQRFIDSESVCLSENIRPTSVTILSNEIDVREYMYSIVANPPASLSDRDFAVSSCMAIYRRAIIENNNLAFHSERELISEDLVFNLDYLLCASCVAYVDVPYYNYRYTEGSLTQSNHDCRIPRYIKLHNYLLSWCKKNNISVEMNCRIARMTIGHIRSGIKLLICSSRFFDLSVLRLLKQQLDDSDIQSLFKDYPWHKMPFKHAIICFLIEYKLYVLLISVMKVFSKIAAR